MITEYLKQIPHLKPLAESVDKEFGPYADVAWMTYLVMGTCYAGNPVAARLVGGQDDVQDMIARSVIRTMPQKPDFLSRPRITELSKVMEDDACRPRSLILRDISKKNDAVDAVYRMIRGHIEIGNLGENSVSRPSVLILEGDEITDLEVQKKLITLPIPNSEECRAHMAKVQLSRALDGAAPEAGDMFASEWLERNCQYADSAVIKRAYTVAAAADDDELVKQLGLYQSVVEVFARLMTPAGKEQAVVVETEHLEQVQALYRSCGVPAKTIRISSPAIRCLRVLQRYQQENGQAVGEKHGALNSASAVGNFSRYDIQLEPEFKSHSIDAVAKWFKELEGMGLIVRGAPLMRKTTFSLTPYGRRWNEGLLADQLAACFAPPATPGSSSTPTNSDKE